MGKSWNLLLDEREQIVMPWNQNNTFAKLSSIINRSEIVYKQRWYKFLKTGTYSDQPKNGRQRKTTLKINRRIHYLSKKDRITYNLLF